MKKYSRSDLATVGVLGALLGVSLGAVIDTFTASYIPQTEQVQQGYVIPRNLEINVRDLDGNGEKETILSYEGQDYLLTLDSLGVPRIQAYDIEPARIVPRN